MLKKVLQLRFLLKKKSKRHFLGAYRSAFKGEGVTFSDFREYSYGDDIRSISWLLTAKMGCPYIKLFEEDRGLTFFLMVDVSASSYFGSSHLTKKQVAEQISTVIALSAEQNQDQVGLLLFSDQVEHYIPPKKGRNHTLRILRDIHQIKTQSKQTKFQQPCSYLRKILKKRSHIFLLSDFLSDDFSSSISLLRHRHDITAIILQDPLETNIPHIGLIDLEDAESGQTMTVDTSSTQFRKDYQQLFQEQKQKREKMLKKSKVDYLYINTQEDIFKPLIQYVKQKEKHHE